MSPLSVRPTTAPHETRDLKSHRVKDQRHEEEQRLVETAKEFEALLMGMMLKSMRATIPKSEWMQGGHGEEIYTSLLDDEYAKIMADQGSQSLTQLIADQMRGQLPKHTLTELREAQGQKAYLETLKDF